MIKNIVFDMGEVLIHFNIRDFADRYDLPEEDKELLLQELFLGNADWALCDWGFYTEEEVAERACRKLPERLHEAAYGITCHWFEPVDPVDGMADVVRRLKEAGYGIYLLSNAGVRHRTYWNNVPGSEYFDGVVASAYEKMIKPQPEFYRLLLDRFSLKAEECLFIDDRALNLAGAELCGMKAVLFTDAKKLLADLKELGVLLP